jgi:O-antigen ligase
MSRSTKLIVMVSNLAALWLIAKLVSAGVPPILVPTLAAFGASWLAALVVGDLATSIVLSTIYLVPAACTFWLGRFLFSYYAIWMAALCGAMLPRAVWSRWSYPGRLSTPLVLWALTLALSWPIVALRELDFVPALLTPSAMPETMLPQLPGVTVIWIASVASIALTGLLLFDWLFLAYPTDKLERFESHVIWPLFATAACAAAVALYQALVDIRFLNPTLFANIGRAVGTMTDANAFGAIVALWCPVAAAMLASPGGRSYTSLAWSAVLLAMGVAVWASGSRTALLATLVGLAVVVVHARRSLTTRKVLTGVLAGLLACAAVFWLVPSTTWTRARAMVPSLSWESLQSFGYQLWSRDLYGTASVQMIAEHPVVGVGVGGFNYLYGQVLYRMNHSVLPPDNAQNWFRQQLAELGVLGSLGWMVAVAIFSWALVRRPDGERNRVKAGAAKGGILGLAAASMLGMPTQDAAASISFVVVAYWCLILKDRRALAVPDDSGGPGRGEWAVILLVLGSFLGATVYTANTDLRPPIRALQTDTGFRYGFFRDKLDPTIRWTGAKAVEVFTADKRWLKLELGAVAPDAAEHPVQVRVSLNGSQILRVSRRSDFPIVRWIRMPDRRARLMLQIDVDRTWRRSDPGGLSDLVERGVAVGDLFFAWEDPPKGSVTIESPDLYLK